MTALLLPRERPPVAALSQLTIQALPRPEEVRRVRRAVDEALATWKVGRGTADALLVVSELVTNAVRHAPDHEITITVAYGDGLLLIEVDDGSTAPPIPRHRAGIGEEDSGRGLELVRSIAVDWGWHPRDSRAKRVWALLRSADRGTLS